jgi:hypothetical protein
MAARRGGAGSIRGEANIRGVSEYQVRKDRELARGLKSVRAGRTMRQRARAQGLDPNTVKPYDFPAASEEQPHGLQGPFGPSPTPDWDYYWPTKTKNAQRKYSQMARYSKNLQRMEIVFRDGTPWHWNEVDDRGWDFFRRSLSTYDMIRNPAGAPFQEIYGRGEHGGWGNIVGE